jgi:hypothetical protein
MLTESKVKYVSTYDSCFVKWVEEQKLLVSAARLVVALPFFKYFKVPELKSIRKGIATLHFFVRYKPTCMPSNVPDTLEEI